MKWWNDEKMVCKTSKTKRKSKKKPYREKTHIIYKYIYAHWLRWIWKRILSKHWVELRSDDMSDRIFMAQKRSRGKKRREQEEIQPYWKNNNILGPSSSHNSGERKNKSLKSLTTTIKMMRNGWNSKEIYFVMRRDEYENTNQIICVRFVYINIIIYTLSIQMRWACVERLYVCVCVWILHAYWLMCNYMFTFQELFLFECAFVFVVGLNYKTL